MASYIGKVQIGPDGDQIPIGSTLYGVCTDGVTEAAKEVTLPDFDRFMHGITVQVRFVYGNSVTTGVTLQVGSTAPFPVVGNCVCAANDIIAFTLSQTNDGTTWYANHSILVQEGSTDGTIKVAGQEVAVHGLGSAAYENTNAFATATQGQKADNAMPKDGGTFTGPVFMSESTTDSSEALAIATKDYVLSKTAGLSGLTGAMHFRGSVNPLPDATVSNTYTTYDSGDVVLGPNNKEYVYYKGNDAASSRWIELGDEGSYVLQSSQSTANINNVTGLTSGTLPTLTPVSTTASLVTVAPGTAPSLSTDTAAIPVVTQAGTATTATVNGGVLTITVGSNTKLSQTNASVISTVSFQAGTTPSIITSNDVTFGAVDNNSFNGGAFPTVVSSPVTVVVPVTTP